MSLFPRPDVYLERSRLRRCVVVSTLLVMVSVGAVSASYIRQRAVAATSALWATSHVRQTLEKSAPPAPRRLIRSVRSFVSVQVMRKREKPYNALIAAAAREHGIDPALLRAVIQVESNFAPRAVSRVGARGLMQLMPATAGDLGVRRARRLYDPRTNIRTGAAYLSVLAKRFGETNADWIIAAYNAGPGAVEKYRGVPPYAETREYVRRVAKLWGSVQAHPGADVIVSG